MHEGADMFGTGFRRAGRGVIARLASALGFVVFVAATASAQPALPAASNPFVWNPPLGPYIGWTPDAFDGVPTYSRDDRLVLTPYFYWYDVYSGEHLFDADGSDALTDHPATFTGFSYRSSSWHRTQLEDMAEAGIDVVLPVYWGEPSSRRPGVPIAGQSWSDAGIPPLVEARDAALAAGKKPPRIGLFYDTSTLRFNAANQAVDLTTARGKAWFYETIRDFYSLVPPRHWAMIDGKPIVFLYSASFATRHDNGCLEYLRSAFARDFGGREPFVVREISWNVAADDVYAWGGALGLKNPGLASLGPGYDHSAVPGRDPLVVPRADGAFYRDNWLRFLRRPSRRVFVETWNEFHEGTDIAHSREYGRAYIAATRRFVDLFKAGYRPTEPTGPYDGARSVEVRLGPTNAPKGLIAIESGDGLTVPSIRDNRECRELAPNPYGPRYAYFRIDDGFKWAERMEVLVVVDFYDAARGVLRVEFDGSDPAAPFQGAYTAGDPIALDGSGRWRVATFRLRGARFLNGQNGGADFRLAADQVPLGIARVQVLREGLSAGKFDPVQGFELAVFGAPGVVYELESSNDLTHWNLSARLRPAAGVSRHVAPADPSPGGRWFRLRRPPG
ncbi:MAG: DUF5010 domain-containing protein [Verrucomicrobiales bacterium]|nr:DUF5010 domain-containing protein [Verrucomicrobiales bacterium]